MHFKSAVFFCAVCFLTPAWSIGLITDQLTATIKLFESTNELFEEKITRNINAFLGIEANEKAPNVPESKILKEILSALAYDGNKISEYFKSIGIHDKKNIAITKLYNDYKISTNAIFVKEIPKVIKQFYEIEEPVFKYDPNLPESSNLKELLLAIAYSEDKLRSDFLEVLEDLKLMPLEVDFFLHEFTGITKKFKQEEYLTIEQLSDVLKSLKFNEEIIENIKNENGDCVINGARYLLIMLDNQPDDNGLSLTQIEDFANLYKDQTINTGCFDPLKIKNIFKEFSIATLEQESITLFKPNRPAAIELMDLMIVTADRSINNDNMEEKVLCSEEIRFFIEIFIYLDKDKNGLIDNQEYSIYQKHLDHDHEMSTMNDFLHENPEKVSVKYKFDNENEINIAEFLKMITFYMKIVDKKVEDSLRE